MVRLGRLALAAAVGDPRAGDRYSPDAALANYYDRDARMGMHQDKDERDDAPVVSLSVGDACTFRFGNSRDRGRPYKDILLASGDLFVFGGPARFAYHGASPRFTQAPPRRPAACPRVASTSPCGSPAWNDSRGS
jgi:DNA oxidative demethylase